MLIYSLRSMRCVCLSETKTVIINSIFFRKQKMTMTMRKEQNTKQTRFQKSKQQQVTDKDISSLATAPMNSSDNATLIEEGDGSGVEMETVGGRQLGERWAHTNTGKSLNSNMVSNAI